MGGAGHHNFQNFCAVYKNFTETMRKFYAVLRLFSLDGLILYENVHKNSLE